MSHYEKTKQYVDSHERRTASGKVVDVKSYVRSGRRSVLSQKEINEVMAGRTDRAVKQDKKRKGHIAKDEMAWKRHPERHDLKGVDYPVMDRRKMRMDRLAGGKKKTARKPQ